MVRAVTLEDALVHEGVEALRRIGFLQDALAIPPSQKDGSGKLRLKGTWGIVTFHLDVQPKVKGSALTALTHRRRHGTDRRLLLVTAYVPPTMAEQLQERHIEFLDAAGNAYLDDPIHIFVAGKKATRPPVHLNRALRPAGLRLLYVLLKKPGFLKETQRDLARAAGIALGSVPIILQDLRERGYLQRTGEGAQSLVNTRELLFRWEQGYAELLRPKLLTRTCRLAGSHDRIDDLVPRLRSYPGLLLGGELGAAVLTKHLRAETATLHHAQDEKAVMSSIRLMPDPHGNITLLKMFGTENAQREGSKELNIADPLLIHAELALMTSGRIEETGKILLDKYILPRLA